MQEYKEIQIEVTKVNDAHKIAVRLKSCQDDYKTMKLELDMWFHCHQLVQLTNVAEHVICAARQRPSSNVGSGSRDNLFALDDTGRSALQTAK